MEIQVERPAATIIGDADTDAVGGLAVGPQSLTYTVTNLGDLPLDITAASFASSNAVNVTNVVFTSPATNPVPSLGTTTFQVDFDVTAVGAFSFDFLFNADDPRLGDTEFNISVLGDGAEAEIDVQRPAGTSIASGGTDAQGDVAINAVSALTCTIDNSGGADLDITGTPAVTVQNASGNVSAAVVAQPSTPVGSMASTTFDVEFTVDTTGPFSFDLVIENNDANEDPYTITISGTGVDDSGTGGAGGTGGDGGQGGQGAQGGQGGQGGNDVTGGGVSDGGEGGGTDLPRDDEGCSCQLPGTRSTSAWFPATALALLGLARRRRAKR